MRAPHDQPRSVCTAWGADYQGRGGRWYHDCVEYGVGCLKPLVLDTEDGKLICRLRQQNDQG